MALHPKLKAFNFQKWVEDNADKLRPPAGNQILHKEGDMFVMVVGGPSTHVDFHDDPVEEWFFQVKGNMLLKIAEEGKVYDVHVREGEVIKLPPHMRHASQRPQEGTVGLVVQPPRQPGMNEGFEWFCFNCEARVHRAEIAMGDPEGVVIELSKIYSALQKIYDEFHNSTEARTCPNCGTVHPGNGNPPADWVQL